MSDSTEKKRPGTARVVIAFVLDLITAFFVFGYLIGWLTGGVTEQGFSLEGLPALALFAVIIAYFIVGNRFFKGTLWKHIFRIPV